MKKILDLFIKKHGKEVFHTILIFPGDGSRIRQFKIPHSVLKGVLLFSISLFIILLFIVHDYVYVRHKAKEAILLKEENYQQMLKLKYFAGRVSALESQLEKLKQLEVKLRTIMGSSKRNGLDMGKEEVGGSGGFTKDYSFDFSEERSPDTLAKNLDIRIDQLKKEIADSEGKLQQIFQDIIERRSIIASTPSIWPVRGWITSEFGYRYNPFTSSKQFHEGIDIAADRGTPVRAVADGIVASISSDAELGNNIIINHGFGISTRYAHLSQISVKVGQKVKKGEIIGKVGSSGLTTGPHLHYEVRMNGIAMNPRKYLLE